FVDPVEDAVDEAARLLRAELLGDLDRLVDHDLRRHLGGAEDLIDGHTQNVAVHDRHALEDPVLGVLLDHLVDLGLVRLRATDERLGERPRLAGERMARPELLLVRDGIVLALKIELVEELESDFPGPPARAHLSGAARPQQAWVARKRRAELRARGLCVAHGRREVLGGLRELERPRYPVDLDGVPGEARAAEHLERAVHETLRDALVEAGCDDREPEGAPQRTRAAHSGRATGHLSPGAT